MIVQQFLRVMFEDPKFLRIQYDTLYMLHILPIVIDGKFAIRRGFSLASGANIEVPQQSIASPFCDCSMVSADEGLVWRDTLPKYEAQPDSIISLARTVLKEKYVANLNFDRYTAYIERLTHIDYIEAMMTVEEKITSGQIVQNGAEKAKLLNVLFFFSGVPSSLVNYYDTEGKFLAEWLKRNCL